VAQDLPPSESRKLSKVLLDVVQVDVPGSSLNAGFAQRRRGRIIRPSFAFPAIARTTKRGKLAVEKQSPHPPGYVDIAVSVLKHAILLSAAASDALSAAIKSSTVQL